MSGEYNTFEQLRNVSEAELINLAASAEKGHLEASEALIREELYRRQLARQALSSGCYDASGDEYPTVEHPKDDQWAVKLDDNPNVIPGVN